MPTANISRFGGMNTAYEAPSSNALLIENFTRDPVTGVWDNRIGYEKFFPSGTAWRPFDLLERIDSLYIWSRHGSALEWVLFESGGELYQVSDWGNLFSIDSLNNTYNPPTPSGTAAHYTEFGRFLIITNGTNKPIKYVGWPSRAVTPSIPQYQLGWNFAPAAPNAWEVDTNPATLGSGGEIFGLLTNENDTLNQVQGLGSADQDDKNKYRWRVSFVTFGGAESPISPPSNAIKWTTPADNELFTVGMQIPTGPEGTLARNIYRTKNLLPGVPEIYYFDGQVPNNIDEWYFSSSNDDALGSEAPSEADSVALPSTGARYCATFDGSLWIDGGAVQGTRIYSSVRGTADQFAATDYFELGMRQGGDVRGLRGFNNMLVVLRENAVDGVRRDSSGNRYVVPLMEHIGSRATDTLTEIPGIGVVFLANDGVYVLSGGLDGGGQVGYRKISTPIDRIVKRMNRAVMARATAAYSHKWREWHCYFAIDGSDVNNYGIVYHVDSGDWSVRPGWPVGCLTVNPEGELVFGHVRGNTSSNAEADLESGLFVISRKRAMGSYLVNEGTNENPQYVEYPSDPPVSKFRTEWLSFAGDRKSNAMFVYVRGRCMGNNTLSLNWYVDYSVTGVAATPAVLQDSDAAKRPVFDTTIIGSESVWQDQSFSTFRFSIAPKQCEKLMIELVTSADFVIAGMGIDFNERGNQGIEARRV